MGRIKYEWGRGARRGDQVKIWTKVMLFWLATIGWLVRQVRRRGVVVWVAWRVCMDGGTELAALSLPQGLSLPVVTYLIKSFLPLPFA